jgi:hypothetical protein
MIGARAQIADNTRHVKKRADAGTIKSLGQAGGTIRKIAARSIRKRKKPSRPGQAPHTPTGNLRRALRYEVTRQRDNVVVGPVNQFGGRLWDLLEFGGKGRGRKMLKEKKHDIGDYGPVALTTKAQRAVGLSGAKGRDTRKDWRKRTYVRVKLRTARQAARADRLIAKENAARAEEGRGNYAPRPFMGPALAMVRPRLPKFWRNSVSS